MKRLIVPFLLLGALLPAFAEGNSGKNLIRMNVQMQKLWQQKQYLQAMDTAVFVLTIDNDNRAASDFVYRNWDTMTRWTENRLQRLYNEESIEESEERCEIYRLLSEINNNLRTVPMPLYGPREKWVWQPEINYYDGHYDTERTRLVRLLMRRADGALFSHDTETAKQYYTLALNKYLLTEGERVQNLDVMLQRLQAAIEQYASSDRIHEAVFAYELMELSLTLQPQQPEMEVRRADMQQRVADLYLKAAEQALLQGDSVASYEYRLSYEDWKVVVPAED